jgi:uncharacterized membrane protein YeaQ/YmgE (transglycosylase-associated protein family)
VFNYYFNIGLTYVLIGFAVALITYFVMRKQVVGRFWGALIVGLVGSFLGGLVDYLFADIIHTLANLNNSVNVFPPILTALFVLLVFAKASESLSERRRRKDRDTDPD